MADGERKPLESQSAVERVLSLLDRDTPFILVSGAIFLVGYAMLPFLFDFGTPLKVLFVGTAVAALPQLLSGVSRVRADRNPSVKGPTC